MYGKKVYIIYERDKWRVRENKNKIKYYKFSHKIINKSDSRWKVKQKKKFKESI